jgi:hypothetical protein
MPEQDLVLLPGDPEARDSECERVGAVGDDPESLARLQKTVSALAHVHAILVHLRERDDKAGGAGGGDK